MSALLSVEGLGITFGGLRAVHDVSFKVQPGEILSVIGPNGAGKTTLFNMISGVYRPGAGRIVLNGEDVTAMRPDLLARRGMSRTFQNLQIFQNMSVLDNAIAGYHLQESGSFLADLLRLPASRARAACRYPRVTGPRFGPEAGTCGQPPVAIRMCLALYRWPSTSTQCASTSRACPVSSVTPLFTSNER